MAKYVSEERLNEIVKMINKLLCFMWGHTYKTNVRRVDYQYIFYDKCKHCGKMLQHPNRIESP